MSVAADIPTPSGLPHILVVDDDARLCSLLSAFLRQEGFRVTAARSAEAARRHMAALTFDAFILDITMPGESGLSLARDLRATSDVPILILTARGLPEDRIAGLEAGADDYLPKPFEPRELSLRVRGLLRRAANRGDMAGKAAAVRFGAFSFDLGTQILRCRGEPIQLTEGERAILTSLAARPGAPLSRKVLAEASGADGDRAVDVRVARLRRKLEAGDPDHAHLRTIRGIGYALYTEPEAAG